MDQHRSIFNGEDNIGSNDSLEEWERQFWATHPPRRRIDWSGISVWLCIIFACLGILLTLGWIVKGIVN